MTSLYTSFDDWNLGCLRLRWSYYRTVRWRHDYWNPAYDFVTDIPINIFFNLLEDFIELYECHENSAVLTVWFILFLKTLNYFYWNFGLWEAGLAAEEVFITEEYYFKGQEFVEWRWDWRDFWDPCYPVLFRLISWKFDEKAWEVGGWHNTGRYRLVVVPYIIEEVEIWENFFWGAEETKEGWGVEVEEDWLRPIIYTDLVNYGMVVEVRGDQEDWLSAGDFSSLWLEKLLKWDRDKVGIIYCLQSIRKREATTVYHWLWRQAYLLSIVGVVGAGVGGAFQLWKYKYKMLRRNSYQSWELFSQKWGFKKYIRVTTNWK